MIIKKYYDLIMPEITLPENGEMLGIAYRIKATDSYECREAMFMLARYFRREFRFDGIQYASLRDKEDDNDVYAYALTLETNYRPTKATMIGAFVFRKREWGGYGFQWMWLHPFVRNYGLLTKLWRPMREKFGDFYCEPPLSPAMLNFLKKTDKNGRHTAYGNFRKAPHLLIR